MLRHLVGDDLGAAGSRRAADLHRLLEPVKHYERGGIAAQVEPAGASRGSRRRRASRQRRRRAPLPPRSTRLSSDRAPSTETEAEYDFPRQLGHWRLVATDVIRLRAANTPPLTEALQPAAALQAPARWASEALASLASGKPLDAEHTDSRPRHSSTRRPRPNGSATELPILRPIRRLAAAASLQGERPGFSSQRLARRASMPRPLRPNPNRPRNRQSALLSPSHAPTPCYGRLDGARL